MSAAARPAIKMSANIVPRTKGVPLPLSRKAIPPLINSSGYDTLKRRMKKKTQKYHFLINRMKYFFAILSVGVNAF